MKESGMRIYPQPQYISQHFNHQENDCNSSTLVSLDNIDQGQKNSETKLLLTAWCDNPWRREGTCTAEVHSTFAN